MSFTRNALANLTGTLVSMVLPLLFNAIYLAILTREEFGLFGVSATLAGVVTVFDFGLSRVTTREVARHDADRRGRNILVTMGSVNCAIAMAVSLSLILFSNSLVTDWLKISALPHDVAVKAICLIAVILGTQLSRNIFLACLNGLQRQVLAQSLTAAGIITRGLCGIAAASLTGDIVLVFVAQLAVAVAEFCVFAFLTWHSLPQTGRLRFDFQLLRENAGYATYDGATSVTALIFSVGDRIVLSSYLPLGTFGLYSFASSVAFAAGRVASPFVTATFPRLVGSLSSGDNIAAKRDYKKLFELVACIAGASAITLMFFPHAALILLSGSNIWGEDIANVLRLLAFGVLFNLFAQVPHSLYLASRRSALGFWTGVVGFCFYFPVAYLLLPSFGIYAPAIALAPINAFNFLALYFLTNRLLMPGQSWNIARRHLVPPLLGAAMPVLLLHFFLPHATNRLVAFLELATVASLSLICASMLTAIVRGEVVAYIRKLAGVST